MSMARVEENLEVKSTVAYQNIYMDIRILKKSLSMEKEVSG